MKHFLIVLLLVGSALGNGHDPHDGNWWRTLSHDKKIAYVVGYSDGNCAGEIRVWTALPLDYTLHSGVASSVFPKGPPYAGQCEFPEQTTYGQISDAIDQFYHDASNRLIFIDDGWRYVKAKIEGTPWSAAKLQKERENIACASTPGCIEALVKKATSK
jgi:hypothetical protein